MRAGGPRIPRESIVTIYEVTYTDTARRRSGEPEEEAVGRVVFVSQKEALAFQSRHGGEFSSRPATETEREQLIRPRGQRGSTGKS